MQLSKGFVFQLTMVMAFLIQNTALNMFNKWLFTDSPSGAGFSVPLFVTMVHSIAGFGTALLFTLNPTIYQRKEIKPGLEGWGPLIAIAAFFTGGIGFNNSSLLHLPLSTAQMIKSTHPAVLAVCLYLVEGTTQTRESIMAISGIVFGVALAVLGNQSASFLGVTLSILSVLSGAMHTAYLSLNLGPKVQLAGLDVLLYTNPLVVLLLFVPFWLTTEPEVLYNFVRDEGFGISLIYLLFGSILAVSYNLTSLFFIKSLSALYMSVTGTVKVVIIIVLSIIFFGDEVSAINAVGILIALTAFGFNSYLTYKVKMAKLESARGEPTPREEDNDDENQPLIKDD